MAITLCLMGKKGLAALQHIVESGHQHLVDVVYTCRDKGVRYDYHNEIIQLCDRVSIKAISEYSPEISTEYTIAIAWRWMLNTQHTRLITLHDSILPRYRGFLH